MGDLKIGRWGVRIRKKERKNEKKNYWKKVSKDIGKKKVRLGWVGW